MIGHVCVEDVWVLLCYVAVADGLDLIATAVIAAEKMVCKDAYACMRVCVCACVRVRMRVSLHVRQDGSLVRLHSAAY